MSKGACEANQRMAKKAITSILEDEMSVFQLDEEAANRMMVCGKCPVFGDYDRAKKAFRESFSALADKLSSMEWDADPELIRRRRLEVSREYREKHADLIRDRNRDRNRDRRIEKLQGGLL